MVFQAVGDKVKITMDGTDADGKPTHVEWTGKFDGTESPVTGDPHSDARSVKKVDDHTMTFTIKKNGKVMITGRHVISPDGMIRISTIEGTDPKGNKISGTGVYDKQQVKRRDRKC